MKITELKKDRIKSVRINSEALKIIEDAYGTIQKFLDQNVEKEIKVEIKDNKLN